MTWFASFARASFAHCAGAPRKWITSAFYVERIQRSRRSIMAVITLALTPSSMKPLHGGRCLGDLAEPQANLSDQLKLLCWQSVTLDLRPLKWKRQRCLNWSPLELVESLAPAFVLFAPAPGYSGSASRGVARSGPAMAL